MTTVLDKLKRLVPIYLAYDQISSKDIDFIQRSIPNLLACVEAVRTYLMENDSPTPDYVMRRAAGVRMRSTLAPLLKVAP